MSKAKKIISKLKLLPSSPGVYFHKNASSEIIYVGKAAVLKNRVRQYFQKSNRLDIKTQALISEIADVDWLETDSEIDALFLEAEMVKRYMPKYNILLRDDKSLTYIRIDMKSEWPCVSFTRNPLGDDAVYFGPFYNGFLIKKAMRYLRKSFPYYLRPPKPTSRPSLDDQIGLTPYGMTSQEYKRSLNLLTKYITGNRKDLLMALETEMRQAAKVQDFELAAMIRNQLLGLKELKKQIMFGDKEFLDISKDEALKDLSDLFVLRKEPYRIEGYDISHLGGTNVVASMVVFKNGVSSRSDYRKFKIRVDKNDDFANMQEVISRRFSQKNQKLWGVPDLVLIDGGKGQLDAAFQVNDELGVNAYMFGLAKREEQIVLKSRQLFNKEKVKSMGGNIESSKDYNLINLPNNSHVIKLLQRIRDESHRFAISYQRTLKIKSQTKSLLLDIRGVGPVTTKKLILAFGGMSKLRQATENEIAKVAGERLAKIIKANLG